MLRHAYTRIAFGALDAATSSAFATRSNTRGLLQILAATVHNGWFCSTSASSPDAGDTMSEMVDLMMRDPGTQQLLLSKLPPHLRKPEVLRAMMANPEVKQRINALAKSAGLDKVWASMGADRLEAGLAAARASGVDPAALFARLHAHPQLAPKLQDPRVLAALMDCCSNGPEALKKYEGDKEVLDAYMEAADILQKEQQQQVPGAPGSCSSSSGSISSGSSSQPEPPSAAAAAMEQQLGVDPQQLMGALMQRPELLSKMQDPEVMEALNTIAKSPWKMVKYMFNPKVTSALKELKEVMQKSHADAGKKA